MQSMVFIGEKLKDLRLKGAMSQRKLAEALGVEPKELMKGEE
jgi:transcriptional regulator with XRE-family HTH domain